MPIFSDATLKVARSYPSLVAQAYSLARFQIIKRRMLEEVAQYFPQAGTVLDIGCGFGLFTMYFAERFPRIQFHGMDLNEGRIDAASAAASRIGLRNVSFAYGDARKFAAGGSVSAVYLIDIVHHIPASAVPHLLGALRSSLPQSGRLLNKYVGRTPAYKRHFTHLLDRIVDPKTPVHYWSIAELRGLLERNAFEVYHHEMVDILPYPHVLHVCTAV